MKHIACYNVCIDSTSGHFITFSGFYDAPKIYSHQTNCDSFRLEDILYFLNGYDSNIWLYLFHCLILFTIIFYTIAKMVQISIKFHSFIRYIFEYLWNYFMLSVDVAPTSTGGSFPTSILWTSIVTAFFYAFHIVLMSRVSTDLMVLAIKPTIQTLADYCMMNHSMYPLS